MIDKYIDYLHYVKSNYILFIEDMTTIGAAFFIVFSILGWLLCVVYFIHLIYQLYNSSRGPI